VTDNILLNWATMALSLFNAVLLFWLGLTVLLNSDRRTWGIWLGGLGLLLGSAFFVSHSAILGLGISFAGWDRLFWWTMGLALVIALPFAWYVVMLWYAGYWEDAESPLHRRQRPWTILMVLTLLAGFTALVIGVVLLLTPSPSFAAIRFAYHWSVSGIPLLALGYAAFVILCISLSVDALRRPGPSTRVMGSLARQRARPWLTAASLVLLVVSLVIGGMTVWLVQGTRSQNLAEFYAESILAIVRLDLIISFLIAAAVVLLGQATVSYEVFTGKTLPRRGLQNQWRWAIVLAAGYGAVVGGSIALELHPLYIVLPATLLMTFAFAFASWRSFAERERYIAHLRPFVASQHLYEQLLASDVSPQVDMARPFATLCADVLGARLAYLAALGPLAPLVGPPLAYPQDGEIELPRLAELPQRFNPVDTMIVSLDPAGYRGAIWGVPLWSQRGLIGALLLGEKRDGSLYTQEEIEIARVSGERLIDTQASAKLGQRLMALQRERLAQSQVVDLRTRRLLHDEVLPRLQAAAIALDGKGTKPEDTVSVGADASAGTEASSGVEVTSEVAALLTDTHRQISDLLRQMPLTTTLELERLGVVKALRKSVEGEYAQAFDEVNWRIDPEAAQMSEELSPLAAEVLFYAVREAIRNAVIYGRDPGSEESFCLWLSIRAQEGLEITVEDNGIGLSAASLAPKGSGQGLALHSTMMAIVGGTLAMESLPGRYTRIILSLPEGGRSGK
jgi:signal transduction histidine kinase